MLLIPFLKKNLQEVDYQIDLFQPKTPNLLITHIFYTK